MAGDLKLGIKTSAMYVVAVLFFAFSVFVFLPRTADAAQTTPYKINYQGRLTNAAGVTKPNGQYNMKFRIFNVLSGGSAVWTEVRETTNRVTVTNGQFNVQLGDVTALTPSVFTSQPLYFEVELPTPATATCSTASCAVFTEGAMTPRQPIAASAYAMNADTLDGYDASEFASLAGNMTFTASNLFKNSSNSSSAFGVSNVASTSLFAVDTSASSVSIGSTSVTPPQFGRAVVGASTDTSNGNVRNFARYQTGSTAGQTSQISVNVSGPIEAAPNNKVSMAIYSGTATVPVTLLAVSSESTLTPGWNTVPISVSLSPSTYYWLAYTTNSTVSTNNNARYDDGPANSAYQNGLYTDGWPSTITFTNGTGTQAFSFYVDFAPTGGPIISTGSNGRVGIGTASPGTTLGVAGDSLFKNLSNSTTAFQIQTAGAGSLLIADTTGSAIQIGAASADATAINFVLDTKNTVGDPVVAANGAMYYNSGLGKFRCYEKSAWTNCIGGAENVVTLGADVTNNNATANTIANVTGLSFPVVAGTTYRFKALINYTSAATSTGSRWSINGPATTTLSYTSKYTLSATTETTNFASAYNVPAASNAGSLTTGNVARIKGVITPSANGTVTVRFASGVASSAITAKAGSTLMWW
ncbi:MAG TPA: hypothetical protein VF281_04560 [Candidatus Saccharimonadales bacterium]